MSLKAKIEAIIYAAEEPVTLNQIVGLLGQEAQASLVRLASAQQSFSLEDDDLPAPGEPDLLNEEILSIEEDEEDERDRGQAETAEQHVIADELKPTESSVALPPTSEHAGEKEAARQERDRARLVRDYLRQLLDELVRDYAIQDRGLEIREVAGGFRLATKPEYHDAVRGFVRSLKPPLKLSLQALETLAVVAYKQPVTAPEVSEIRGVDSGGVLGSLMARKLVTTAGRKQVVGRPILYRTTKDFLLRFGLKDIQELPSIEEFEKMAGELAETELIHEDVPMTQHTGTEAQQDSLEASPGKNSVEESLRGDNLEQEKNATEPQADGDGSTVEQVLPDGRLSGITPSHTQEENPSAAEADIQQQESNDSQEQR